MNFVKYKTGVYYLYISNIKLENALTSNKNSMLLKKA